MSRQVSKPKFIDEPKLPNGDIPKIPDNPNRYVTMDEMLAVVKNIAEDISAVTLVNHINEVNLLILSHLVLRNGNADIETYLNHCRIIDDIILEMRRNLFVTDKQYEDYIDSCILHGIDKGLAVQIITSEINDISDSQKSDG